MTVPVRDQERMVVEVHLGVLPEDSNYRDKSEEHRRVLGRTGIERELYPDVVFDVVHEVT